MATTYHILQISTSGPEINDIFPQVAQMGAGYRWHDPDSVTKIVSNQPLKVRPNLHSFHLDDATNVTDLVSQSYTYTKGLLASKGFCDALAGYCNQGHETYPAEVVLHGRSYDYQYLHITEDVEERIDYSLSEFSIRRPDGGVEGVEISSVETLRRKRAEVADLPRHTLLANKIIFVPETPAYDLFCVTLTGHVFFVSERLAAELRSRKLTGFELEPGPIVQYWDQGESEP